MTTPSLAADRPLRVGASAGPYIVILDCVVPLAKAQGLTNDTIPNEASFRGDLDVSNIPTW